MATALVLATNRFSRSRPKRARAPVTQPDGFNDRWAAGRDYATEHSAIRGHERDDDIDLDESLYVSNPTSRTVSSRGRGQCRSEPSPLEPGLAGTQRQGRTGKNFPTTRRRTGSHIRITSASRAPSRSSVHERLLHDEFASSEFVVTTPGWHTYTRPLADDDHLGDVTSWTAAGDRVAPRPTAASGRHSDRLGAPDGLRRGSTTYPSRLPPTRGRTLWSSCTGHDGTRRERHSRPDTDGPASLREDSDSSPIFSSHTTLRQLLRRRRLSRASLARARERVGHEPVDRRELYARAFRPTTRRRLHEHHHHQRPGIFLNVHRGAEPHRRVGLPQHSFQLTRLPSNVNIYWKTADGVVHNSPFLTPGAGNVYTDNLGATGVVRERFGAAHDPATAAGVKSARLGVGQYVAPEYARVRARDRHVLPPGPPAVNTPPIATCCSGAMAGSTCLVHPQQPGNMAEASDRRAHDGSGPGYPQFLRARRRGIRATICVASMPRAATTPQSSFSSTTRRRRSTRTSSRTSPSACRSPARATSALGRSPVSSGRRRPRAQPSRRPTTSSSTPASTPMSST